MLRLRIEAAGLLDQVLCLKDERAAERGSVASRLFRRLRTLASGLGDFGRESERRHRPDRYAERCAAVLLKSGLFDPAYYLRRNPEVAAAGGDPVRHYVRHGAAELRSPGPYFSTRWYVRTYPDVGPSGMNPLHHFIVSGYAEGRLPRPPKAAAISPLAPGRAAGVASLAAVQAVEAGGAAAVDVAAASSGQSKARLVVYTVLLGDYDDLFVPSAAQAAGCDFVVFTDRADVPPPWRREHVDAAADGHPLQSRFYKLLPHRLFPEHEWSLYLDANIDLQSSPIEFLERHQRLGADFFVHRHPQRSTITEELAACISRRKDDAGLMVRQVAEYLDRGFRQSFPLTENSVLLRRHNDSHLAKLGEAWWNEVSSKSKRDQLSLTYVVEQQEYRRIALFEDGRVTARHSPDFRRRPHLHQFHLPGDPGK